MKVLKPFFPAPLFVADLPDTGMMNERLIQHIRQEMEEHPQDTSKNFGGVANVYASFAHDSLLHKRPWMRELLERLGPYVMEFCNDVAADMINYYVEVEESWFNVSTFGHFQEYHNHAGGPFSMIYYVKVPPNSGNTVFRAGYPAQKVYYASCDPDNLFTAARRTVEAKAGRMVIFPSWLDHCVSQNKNEEDDRITIAFNMIQNRKPSH